MSATTTEQRGEASVEIFILAGGRSSRMGRDKARLRLGGRSLLAHVRAAARSSGWPVRVVQHDRVPRCGPLGGVFTALGRSKADTVVFLSCDMPFVEPVAIDAVARTAAKARAAFFADADGIVGFPFALSRELLEVAAAQIEKRQFSLQKLAQATRARRLKIRKRNAWCWFNVNTPEEFAEAWRLWREHVHEAETPLVSRTKIGIVAA